MQWHDPCLQFVFFIEPTDFGHAFFCEDLGYHHGLVVPISFQRDNTSNFDTTFPFLGHQHISYFRME